MRKMLQFKQFHKCSSFILNKSSNWSKLLSLYQLLYPIFELIFNLFSLFNFLYFHRYLEFFKQQYICKLIYL